MFDNLSRALTAAVAAVWLGCCIGCAPAPQPAAAQERVEIGKFYLSEGRTEAAVSAFEEAVRLDPEATEAQVQLANIDALCGHVGAAEARFQAILDRRPDDVAALAGWGKFLAATGRLEQAEPVLRRAANADPPSVEAVIDLARVLTALDRDEEALAAWERAAELGATKSTAFLLTWAKVLQEHGRSAAALRQLEEAAAIAPGDPMVLAALGHAYLDVGRADEAINLLQRAVAATDRLSPDYETRLETLQHAEESIPRATARPDMPNVLLVVIDTLRADHVGTYGYEYPTTPNMDHLSGESVVFETAISQAPWTAPAIASIFTGLYPSVHGLDGGIHWGEGKTSAGGTLPFAVQKTLPPGHQTVAEVFRGAGYTTAGFVSNLYVNAIFGFAQGFDHFDDTHEDYLLDDGETKRRAEVTNNHVFEWLQSGIEEPFFLVVHYNDPHWPYEPPPPFGQSFVEDYTGTLTPTTTREIVVTHGEEPPPISDRDLAYIIGLYDGEIQYMDAHLGRLLEAVGDLPTKRSLVTVLTADHGEEFFDHGAFNHGYTLYEEQTSVPFMVSAPSRFAPRRVTQQVRLIDAAPTLLEMAGIDIEDARFQGRSLVPLMTGARLEDLDAFSEATNVGRQSAIRSIGGLKLIHSLIDPEWLFFDLEHDPGEQRDVSAQDAEKLQELAARIARWRQANHELYTEINASGTGFDHVVLDEKTQKGLEALGYIDP